MKLITLAIIFFVSNAYAANYRVGVIVPLTGVVADYGVAIQRSLNIAKSKYAKSLEGVQFLFEDVGYDPKLAVQAFYKLKDQDKVDLIYVWGVSFCKAIAPLADKNSMPIIGQCIDPESGRDRRYFMRFQNYTDQYMEAQAKELLGAGHKKISIIVSEHPYPDELLKAFKKHLQVGQELNVVDYLPTNEMDFRTQIIRLKNSQTDAVGVFLMPGQIAAFFRQAGELNYKSSFFGTNLFESNSEVKAAGQGISGTVFIGHKISEWFINELEVQYGDTTQLSFAALAYDFAVHLGKALEFTTSKLHGLELLTQIQSLKTMQGEAAGRYVLRDTKEAGKFFEFELVAKTIE